MCLSFAFFLFSPLSPWFPVLIKSCSWHFVNSSTYDIQKSCWDDSHSNTYLISLRIPGWIPFTSNTLDRLQEENIFENGAILLLHNRSPLSITLSIQKPIWKVGVLFTLVPHSKYSLWLKLWRMAREWDIILFTATLFCHSYWMNQQEICFARMEIDVVECVSKGRWRGRQSVEKGSWRKWREREGGQEEEKN